MDELELRAKDGAVLLRLRVRPGGRRNGVVGPHGGALKLTVTAAPERGKANRAVLQLLADRLALPVSSFSLVSGESSPDKVVAIHGLAEDEIRSRLGRSG